MYLFEKIYMMLLLISASAYKTLPMNAKTKPPPLCIDCKHFLNSDPFFKANRAEHGHCRQFYNINLVTGEKTYDFASIARSYENMCGVNASHFEDKRNITRLW